MPAVRKKGGMKGNNRAVQLYYCLHLCASPPGLSGWCCTYWDCIRRDTVAEHWIFPASNSQRWAAMSLCVSLWTCALDFFPPSALLGATADHEKTRKRATERWKASRRRSAGDLSATNHLITSGEECGNRRDADRDVLGRREETKERWDRTMYRWKWLLSSNMERQD